MAHVCYSRGERGAGWQLPPGPGRASQGRWVWTGEEELARQNERERSSEWGNSKCKGVEAVQGEASDSLYATERRPWEQRVAGHGGAACPGWLELGPVGNGEPCRVSEHEQGSEQSLGPYFRNTTCIFWGEDSRLGWGESRGSGGHCCAVSLSHHSAHLSRAVWTGGKGDLGSWSRNSPT